MNTPSHLLINAALHKSTKRRGANVPLRAVLWGSVLPDIPLLLMSLATILYYRLRLGKDSGAMAHSVFHEMYFTDPVWISSHNILHSPVVLGTMLALLWRWQSRPGSWQRWLFWFFMSSSLHSMIDILTHHDDGPLLLWPFNWQLRFHSPVSYWDPAHFGQEFMVFEIILSSLLLMYLLLPWIKKKISHQV